MSTSSAFANLGVFKAINNVQRDIISAGGVSKSQRNHQQKYAFRGIDDMYNTLSPLLARHGLVIMPTVLDREVIEKPSRSGGCLFYVTVKVKYTFISAEDGSNYDVVVYGEAMDSGDKATNKAMSAAFKYMAIQSFAIPTEGDNDADATTHHPQYHQAGGYDQTGGYHAAQRQPTNNQHQHQEQPPSDPAMTPAQVKIIQKALNNAGIQQEALLRKVGIARIGELNDSHFKRALAWIENVKNQRLQREHAQYQHQQEHGYNGYEACSH